MNRKELEDRLINFSVVVIEITDELPNNKVANHLSGQLIRSGTSVSLNYGEAQSGESTKDFLHKMKIVLKELRESQICLSIMNKTVLFETNEKIKYALQESNELISIFVKSIETAQASIEPY